jgi:hypothetical protein
MKNPRRPSARTPSGIPTPAPMAAPRLLLEEDAVALAVVVVVVVTVAWEEAAVAEAMAAEREEICASTASVPGLKASPVLPRVKLLPQQSWLE